MSEIIYGLYEQIINGIINENLNKLDQQLVIKDTQPLECPIFIIVQDTGSRNANFKRVGVNLNEITVYMGKQ